MLKHALNRSLVPTALAGETDLWPLLPALRATTWHCPAVTGATTTLQEPTGAGRPSRLGSRSSEPDVGGIPALIDQPALEPDQMQLLLVPALAADASGIRPATAVATTTACAITSWRHVTALAVVPQSCISTTPLPRDPWDQPFDGWVCETGVHWCSSAAHVDAFLSHPSQEGMGPAGWAEV